MHIVITGHKGQLGRALQEVLKGQTLFGVDLPEPLGQGFLRRRREAPPAEGAHPAVLD